MPNRTTILLSISVSAVLATATSAQPLMPSSLRQGAEEFAQGPVAIDPRLGNSVCEGGFSFRWIGSERAGVEAVCPASGRRVVLPLAGEPQGPQRAGSGRLKRGEAVQAEARGQGFRVRVEAVVQDGGLGSEALGLKNSRTGQRFAGRMVEDGRILVSQSGPLP